MTTSQALRTQRLKNRQSETTEQVIAFQLRDEWFALPIFAVQRVIPLGEVYGDPNQSGISLTRYQDQEILVLDVGHLIFSEPGDVQEKWEQKVIMPSLITNHQTSQRFLAILKLESEDLLGLPIDSPPEVRRIAQSTISEIPSTYIDRGQIRCVSRMMIETDHHPPIFLLEETQLLNRME